MPLPRLPVVHRLLRKMTTAPIPLPHPRYMDLLSSPGGTLWACTHCGKELWTGEGAFAAATIEHNCGARRVVCFMGLGWKQIVTHDFADSMIWRE